MSEERDFVIVSDKKTIKRQAILDIATNMLEYKDYSEVRIEDIAAAVDLSKASFFYYFASKGDLYLEVYHKLFQEFYQDCATVIATYKKEDLTSLEDFEALILQLTDLLLSKQISLIRLMVDEYSFCKDCKRGNIMDVIRDISGMRSQLGKQLADKTKVFYPEEILYLFTCQEFVVKGYFKEETNKFKFYHKEKKYMLFEDKRIAEYRMMRMLRYIITGMNMEHHKN